MGLHLTSQRFCNRLVKVVKNIWKGFGWICEAEEQLIWRLIRRDRYGWEERWGAREMDKLTPPPGTVVS